MIKIVALTVALSFTWLSGFAQLDKIDTDRPDQTESPGIVPKKWMQFEMGFMKLGEKTSQGLHDSYYQHPTLLTKYGLAKCFELRLITELATAREKNVNETNVNTGIGSIQLGGKVNFFAEKGLRPKMSLIAHYDFGRLRVLEKDSVDGFNFRFTMQHTLSNVIGISYNLGMEWDRLGSSPAYIYTFSPGFNITEKWYAYIEAFGFIWKDDIPVNSIDGGVAYNINDNFKLDVSGGFGINKKAPDYYFALGASFRFKVAK